MLVILVVLMVTVTVTVVFARFLQSDTMDTRLKPLPLQTN